MTEEQKTTAAGLRISVREAPEWTALFKREENWTGGDGIYAIPLSGHEGPGQADKTRQVFVFGDIFIGRVDPETATRRDFAMHVEPEPYIRIGESPVGPFGPRIDTYRTQEPDAGQEIYTYNAKAHPSLSPTGEWLVTYNVNSRDWDSLVANGDIYRPRFLWVRFEAE